MFANAKQLMFVLGLSASISTLHGAEVTPKGEQNTVIVYEPNEIADNTLVIGDNQAPQSVGTALSVGQASTKIKADGAWLDKLPLGRKSIGALAQINAQRISKVYERIPVGSRKRANAPFRIVLTITPLESTDPTEIRFEVRPYVRFGPNIAQPDAGITELWVFKDGRFIASRLISVSDWTILLL